MSSLSQTIAGLSPEQRLLLEAVLREQGVDLSRSVVLPQPRREAGCPLSYAQQRLWFLDRLAPGSSLYNNAAAFRLLGSVDATTLGRTFTEVVRRHEVLRTHFDVVAGEPVQLVAPPGPWALPLADLRGLEPAVREREAQRLAESEARRPFDLSRGPLLRVVLLTLGREEQWLLLTMHHIASDLWSMEVLVNEVGALYAAFAAGRPSPLPELPIQYSDFACWQRLRREALAQEVVFWRQQLDGLATLDLPTDRPRPAVQTFAGASASALLPDGLSAGLQRLMHASGATLFMVLLAAFQALLHRYTGQDDIVVGTPISGRRQPETEGLIGFFVNTLVLRTDASGDPGFLQLLAQVRKVTLDAFAHQDLPFDKLVEELNPERDVSRTPLFQVMFGVLNLAPESARLPGIEIRRKPVESGTSKFDLTLTLSEMRHGLACFAEYNRDLFDATTMRRLLEHLTILLQGIAAAPGTSLAALPLLAPAERFQVLVEWNDAAAPSDPAGLLQLFDAWVQRTPEATAVHSNGHNVTCRELGSRANRLARHLGSLGVGPEVPVGVCLERSPAIAVALLAVLKAGGMYLPLDPGYPAQRLAFMLEDSGMMVLLTEESLVEALPQRWGFTVLLDSDWESIAGTSDDPLSAGCGSDGLAYMIYTSGSTGRPKGVMVPHRGLGNLAVAQERLFAMGPDSRVLQFSSPSFDASISELAVTLAAGATLCFADREALLPGPELLGVLRELEITVVTLPPSALAAMPQEELPALRTLVVAGEACPFALAARWGQGRRLINAYGPTETTVCAGAAALAAASGRLPLGRSLAGLQLYLLDRSLNPVPAGVVGEICIAGIGLARGYLGRPELTAEVFLPDPFGPETGQRMYRTGDLGRRLPDGEIEFLGRRDQQVKLRGFRIELGEIEAALARAPGVREAVVAVRQDLPGGRGLLGYLVPKAGARLDAAEVRSHLRVQLPEFMVPAHYVVLEALPQSPNGKLDRRALPSLERPLEQAGAAPRGLLEELVAEIFSGLLKTEEVPRDASFFDLGGHSLLATQLVSRLREYAGVELSVAVVFEAPTPAELARRVDGALHARGGARMPAIEPVARDVPLPLSFAQQRLWFLDLLAPGLPIYNMPAGVRVSGPLRRDAFAAAFSEIVRRHEVLRTTFTAIDGEAVQVVAPARPVLLPLVDLCGLPEPRRLPEALRLGREEARRAFDLARGPLLRVSLVALDEEEHAVLVTMHHIVGDGWSMGVLVRELATLYEAACAGQASPLPELEIQYADYAHWQRQWLSGEVLDSEIAYWRERLGGSPPVLALPADRPRPAMRTFRGARRSLGLPGELVGRLGALARSHGATMFMTLLAAFQALLARYSGQPEVSVGTPIAGRNHVQTEDLIGFFINTLVLRTDLAGDPPFTELLQRVRSVTLGAYVHQDLPFEKLVEELQPVRDLSHTSLFQVLFVLQNTPSPVLQLPHLTLRPFGVDTGVALFDLTLSCIEEGGGLLCDLDYNADLFEPVTAAQMLHQLGRLLQGIVDEPAAPIADLPLLDEEERREVVGAGRGAWRELPEDAGLHGLFERQVARTPDAAALLSTAGTVTYGELDRRADRLARRLRRLGAGLEAPVGICLERSIEALIAMLGVLKAGCAYVPLDPEAPRERLAMILTDAGAELVLTREGLASRLADLPCQTVAVDGAAAEDAEPPSSEPLPYAGPQGAAYVIYTSGSTGAAKGVVATHRGAVSFVHGITDAVSLTAGDRLLLFAPLSFDASVLQIFPTLASGASLAVHSDPRQLSSREILAFCERHSVTVLDLPAARWRQWVDDVAAERLPVPGCLRAFLTGGESVSRARFGAWADLVGRPALFLSSYGPTEATVTATVFCSASQRAHEPTWANVPIGRPLPNARAHVLDLRLRPVPHGIPGELFLGGANLARGYLARPGLTAGVFLPDPLSGEPGERLYRTGDLARFRPDGELEFLGRVDDQVKIRGFRVEPGEVEAALVLHPAVRQCVVAVREDASGSLRLTAYLVAEGAPPAAGELRGFLGERLPEYMIPSGFIVLVQLPVLASGKIDRGALPASVQTRMDGLGGAVAPRHRVEQELLQIWEELLEVRPIGVEDDFFALGGHSLLAVRLAARIEQRFKRPVPLAELFRAPTIEGIAAWLGGDGAAPRPAHLVPLRPEGPLPPFFCVHPAGGGVVVYRELVRHLDPSHPFYGLQARGVDSDEEPCRRVEEMAALYLDAVREAQPAGPYRLGGWSFGALVAFEMARQLIERGEEVAVLALLDAPAPRGEPEEVDEAKILSFFAMEAGLEVASEALRPLDPEERLVYLADLAIRAGLLAEETREAELRFMKRRLAVFRACLQAGQRYLPPPQPVRIALLRARERLLIAGEDPGAADPHLGWSAYTSEPVTVHSVPGNHATMMRNPHLQGVAEALHCLLSESAQPGG
jgi:amino acid adenylation domain-containing protein